MKPKPSSLSYFTVSAVLALALAPGEAAIRIPDIPLPTIPSREFNVIAYGAAADGKTLNTAAFAKAIAACKAAGGGQVIVPAGEFLSGPIEFVSKMELRLEKGAVLRFSDDPSLYNAPNQQRPSAEDDAAELLRIKTPIAGADLSDIAITGQGAIDGNGKSWWVRGVTKFRANGKPAEQPLPRPNLIQFLRCQRILIEGVTISDSPQFHIVPHHCRDVVIRGVVIRAPGLSPNTDGVDPSNSSNVWITRCLIDVGDDNVSFKSYRDEHNRPSGPTQNVYVTDCTFLHGHGVSVGSRVWSGVRNIVVDNCTFDGGDNAIRIKSSRTRGGVVENIVYSNIKMKNVGTAISINLYYFDRGAPTGPQPVTPETPVVRNVRISNVQIVGAKKAGDIVGLPEMPVSGVLLENVDLSAVTGLIVKDARDLEFKNVNVKVTSGKAVSVENAAIKRL